MKGVHLLVLAIVSLFLFNLVSAVSIQSDNSESMSIIPGEYRLTVTKYTGQEAKDYDVILNETDVCFRYGGEGVSPPDLRFSLQGDLQGLRNVTAVRTRVEGVDLYCSPPDRIVQLGTNTIIIENQTTNTVVLNLSDGHNITSQLLWDYNKNGTYDTSVNDLFVDVVDNKHGANWSSDNTSWDPFLYNYSSSLRLTEKNGNYYFTHPKFKYKLKLNDICSPTYLNSSNESEASNNVNCTFQKYHTLDDNNVSTYGLLVYFYNKNGFIDPSLLLELTASGVYIVEGLFEEKPFIHIKPNNESSPYNNDSLTLYVSFDGDTSSQSYDLTENGQDSSSMVNDPTYEYNGGYLGGTYYFNGSEGIRIADNQLQVPKDEITISFWTKPTTRSTSDRFVEKRGSANDDASYILSLSSAAQNWAIGWSVRTNMSGRVNHYGSKEITTTQWHHIVATYSNITQNTTLWVDGVLDGNWTNNNGVLVDRNNDLILGFGHFIAAESLDGRMDEFKMWNRSLSGTEIQNLYNNQSNIFRPNATIFYAADKLNIAGGGSHNAVNFSMNEARINYSSRSEARALYWNRSLGYNNTDADLLACWHFDEDPSDSCGNSSDIFVGSSVTNGSGEYNSSYFFANNSNSFVNVSIPAYGLNMSNELTISFWADVDDELYEHGVVYKGDLETNSGDYAVLIGDGTNPKVIFRLNGNEVTGSGQAITNNVLELGDRHHIVVTYDGSVQSIYVDGNLDGFENFTSKINSNNTPLYIGMYYDNEQPYSGGIDEVYIWNRSLNTDEINKLSAIGRANFARSNVINATVSNGIAKWDEMIVNATFEKISAEITLFSGNSQSNTPYLLGNLTIESTNATPSTPSTAQSPNVTFVDLTTSAGIINQSNISVNITAVDADGDLDNITFYLYNSSFELIQQNNTDTSPLTIDVTSLADGSYYINASANDTSGGIKETATRNITLDTKVPTLVVTSPTNTTYTSYSILFDITATDETLDIVLFDNSTANETYTTTKNITLGEGSYNLTFSANDSLGNVNTTNVLFIVDTSPAEGGGGGGGGSSSSTATVVKSENLSANKTISQLFYYSYTNASAKQYSLNYSFDEPVQGCSLDTSEVAQPITSLSCTIEDNLAIINFLVINDSFVYHKSTYSFSIDFGNETTYLDTKLSLLNIVPYQSIDVPLQLSSPTLQEKFSPILRTDGNSIIGIRYIPVLAFVIILLTISLIFKGKREKNPHRVDMSNMRI